MNNSEHPTDEPVPENEHFSAGVPPLSENQSEDDETSTESSSEQTDDAQSPHPHSSGESDEQRDQELDSESGESEEEEDLPEYEPLTPELVEDEAIRGDFVLRWAVILLALLLGCTEIFESATLIHVKSGQYMASHGVLPPPTDVFSYTADERTWVNLAWLFDLAVAGLFAVGGAAGLSLFKALLAAVTVGFILHTCKPDVPTWWGSFCAGLALLVWYPQFTMRPEIVTLLGLALTLWLLNRWREDGNSRHLRLLVPVYLLWSNLDPSMFLGLSLLLLYALGCSAADFFSRSGKGETFDRKQLWMAVGFCFAVSLINPFGWHSVLAPLSQYGIEYPAYRESYQIVHSFEESQVFPLTSSQIWDHLTGQSRIVSLYLYVLLGLLMLLFAAVTFVLNWERVDFGHLLVYLGFLGFAAGGTHELAAAVLVSCVLATLNGQEWYQANFRQTYSVDFSELLFSRGGRAITVFFFFGISYGTISGNLDGANGRRTGIGFHHELLTTINGLRNDLEGSYDDKPFNFRLEQGDALIWVGQKVFVDSRVALYHGEGEQNLLSLHDKTRHALRFPIQNQQNHPLSNRRDVWKKTFDRFGVTHVLPRLSDPNPDYRTYLDLLRSLDWQLTRLGASTAVFYRTDLTDPQLEKYLTDNQVDFVKLAFRTESSQTAPRAVWPHAPSVYQKYLSLPQTIASADLWLARHYLFHTEQALLRRLQFSPQILSFAYMAIRKANAVLENDPQNAMSYRILGRAYETLEVFESGIAQQAGGGAYGSQRRFYQSVQAYSQALMIEPKHLPTLRRLLTVYQGHNKLDLALDVLRRMRVQTDLITRELTETELQQLRGESDLRQTLLNQFDEIKKQFEELRKQEATNVQLADAAYRSGCVQLALDFLDEDPDATSGNPQLQMFRSLWLMEVGRVQEASNSMERLESIIVQFPELSLSWRTQAAYIGLANAQYSRASRLLMEEAGLREDQRIISMLDSLPLATPSPFFFGQSADFWPLQQTAIASSAMFGAADINSSLLFESALCHLERGDNKTAELQLRQLFQTNPETPHRPLSGIYLEMISGESIDLEPPSQWIPVTLDMFAPEDAASQELKQTK